MTWVQTPPQLSDYSTYVIPLIFFGQTQRVHVCPL